MPFGSLTLGLGLTRQGSGEAWNCNPPGPVTRVLPGVRSEAFVFPGGE